MKKKTLEDQLFILGLVLLTLTAGFLVVFYGLLAPNVQFPPCFCDKYLGFYCPGCGGTRAVTALLRGELLLSLWYHPFVLYAVFVSGAFMLSQTAARLAGIAGKQGVKGLRFHNWYLYGAVVVIVVNFIGKNCLRLFGNITM